LAEIDLVPYSLTFLLGLAWSVEIGLILGSLAHLCLLLHSQARPAVLAQHQGPVTVLSPQGDLAFPALEHLRAQLAQAGGESRLVVLDLGQVRSIDYTAARGLCSAVKGARERGEVVEVCCAREEVLATLRPLYGEGLGARDSVGEALSASSMA
jgi:MFS superfamily sulfate permease-like transporter